ncbi:hypothetical protein [Haloarcula halophila]|uniref:hypothetical protein n=1 Tax=Haloarcula TaxID=2237 RepID=UPI0023E42B91|nr:hypothetical protein [Halomicroarcula sp. DFY41]
MSAITSPTGKNAVGPGVRNFDFNFTGSSNHIADQFAKVIEWFMQTTAQDVKEGANNQTAALVDPIIGTPAPRGPRSSVGGIHFDIAFSNVSNYPWQLFMDDIYWGVSLGLALGLQFLIVAGLGLRYRSMDPVVRKKTGRRLFFAFMSVFFWLPVASLAGQVSNAIGWAIVDTAPTGSSVTAFLSSAYAVWTADIGLLIVVILLSLYIYIKTLLIFIGRWIGLILLTLFMPVLGTLWVLEVWPFNRFAGLSAKIAGAYPGLLVANIPAAILIRLAMVHHTWGLSTSLSTILDLLILLFAAKSQRALVEQSSSLATKGADMFSSATKSSLAIAGAGATLGTTAVAGPAAGSAVAAGQKAIQGKNPSTEVAQVHRSLASQQLAQSGSDGQSSSEAEETPSSSSSTGSSSAENTSDEKPSESTSRSSDTDAEDTNGGLLGRFSTDDGNTPEDSGRNTDQETPGQSAEGPEQSPDTNSTGSGWFSATESGQSSSEIADASQDGYSQGDRVVIDSEDFDHTDKRAVVTSSVPGHVKVRPESRERSEDMTLDASEVAMYEPGPEVDRQFNSGDPVRITADEFKAADSRATVTKPPVPGKEATVRPVNLPGEIEVSEADLAAVPTDSPQPTDTNEPEPAVPEGWDGDDGRDSPVEPERITPVGPRTTTTQSDPLADLQGQDSGQSVVTESGDTSTSAGEHGSEPPSQPQGERSGSEPVSADPPQPGDEVPTTEGVETPGRSATEITDTSPGDQPPQEKKLATTSELDPSDLVANPDAEKYQQGFDNRSQETTQDTPEATERSSHQSDYRGSETGDTDVGSDSSQTIDEALATDNDMLGREAYEDPFETETTESDDS